MRHLADAEPYPLVRFSPRLVQWFHRYTRHYLRRHFHAVRLLHAPGRALALPGPLVIYCNHPSWWDPLLVFFLAYHLFPERQHYGPIDAVALGRYQFFRRLGFFGIEPGTRRGALTFLRVSTAILRRPMTALWLTPEGSFTDPRERPVHLRAGIGHLARHMPGATFLPLALEYPFWQERFPEALGHFGTPLRATAEPRRSTAVWIDLLAQQLETTQDVLAQAARQREGSAFDVLLSGSSGIGGIYDLWRGARARWRGERFQREHGAPDG